MNLLFFTIDFERDAVSDRSDGEQPHAAEGRRPGRLRWIGLGIVAALSAVAAGCGGWLLAGGDATGVELPDWIALGTPWVSAASGDQARLEVTSQPDRATVLLDGHQRGSTPLVLSVAHGMHTLVLKHPDAIDEQRQVSTASDTAINVGMWLRRPTATLLKPAYPGASIADAAFLEDGRLALSMAVPAGSTNTAGRQLREPWIYDPRRGSLTQFETQGSTPRAAEVSISPDGDHVAYLQPGPSASQTGAADAHLKEVWIASSAATAPPMRVFALPSTNASSTSGSTTSADVEEVHDLTWTPDGHHLLVTVRLAAIAGGYAPAPRSRLLLVDASHEQLAAPVELMTLPAEVVAGSYAWAPDGKWVAFLTQATSGSGGNTFVALCAVDTGAGGAISGFRYVADLGRLSDPAGPLPVAAVAWSSMGDGRLVYAAATPKITTSNPLGLPTTSGGEPGLFAATPAGPALTAEEGQRLGSATGLIAPAWPSPDEMAGLSVLALARSDKGNKPLVIRGVDPSSGTPQNLDIVLPATVGGPGVVAARWDLAHGRLLVLARHNTSSSGLLDYWLVQLRARAGGG